MPTIFICQQTAPALSFMLGLSILKIVVFCQVELAKKRVILALVAGRQHAIIALPARTRVAIKNTRINTNGKRMNANERTTSF